ncbi:ROK family protein [Arcobacter sp.]|uniref:ROK family protein n=1 Tax=Arcobacter sp. TaxID=1872629 RepID=UPI003D118B77
MYLYIDKGGTYTRYQIDNGEILISEEKNFISFLKQILQVHKDITHVNISFAGQVNNNIIHSAPNIGIENFDFNEAFPNHKIKIDNDLNCAVLAESKYFNEKNIVALYVGTGIGAGIVTGGNLVHGVANCAGEIGHIPFKATPFLCGCGKNNCVELHTSGIALSKWSKHLGKEIKSLDEFPETLYKEFLEGLMFSVSILVNIFNPKVLVMGGGVISNNPFLVDYIKDNISKYAFQNNLKELLIEMTSLENAPLDGAKLL